VEDPQHDKTFAVIPVSENIRSIEYLQNDLPVLVAAFYPMSEQRIRRQNLRLAVISWATTLESER
jgi:hypothetical protein